MNILVLVAGTNEPSNSNALADAFIQGMQQHGGVEVHKRKLKDLKIEHFTLDFYDPHCSQEEDFCKVQALIEAADGLVIASPIWNFSVPAHLKNLIDRMGSFALDATRSKGTLKGKPFYLIFTGGSPKAAWKGLMRFTTAHMTAGLEYFDGTHIGTHYEARCTQGRGKFGIVVDHRPASLQLMREKGFAFLDIIKRYRETGKLPVGRRVYRTMYNWGQAVMKKL